MFDIQRFVFACSGVALLLAGPVQGQSCKPDRAWQHQHSRAKSEIVSTDIKGNRGTHIEVCRDEVASGANLNLIVLFEGERKPTVLAQGKCAGHIAKWAIVRSTGVQAAPGTAAEAKGVYRLCRS